MMNISLKLRVNANSVSAEDGREVCNVHMEVEMSGTKIQECTSVTLVFKSAEFFPIFDPNCHN